MLKEVLVVRNHAWQEPGRVRQIIATFLSKQVDGLYEVTIRRVTENRSIAQNRYYWKLLEYLAPELGFESKESCHALIMQDCGFGRYVKFRDKTYFERKSSTELDKDEFKRLIDKCFEIAAFLNEDREPDAKLTLPRAGDEELAI